MIVQFVVVLVRVRVRSSRQTAKKCPLGVAICRTTVFVIMPHGMKYAVWHLEVELAGKRVVKAGKQARDAEVRVWYDR